MLAPVVHMHAVYTMEDGPDLPCALTTKPCVPTAL